MTVTLSISTLFALADGRVIGSVTIILCSDVLFVIESTDIERTAVDCWL